ncbi:MAG: ABC transporter substrate-binding protein [Thermoplasmataceae archaeon]
MNTTQKYIMTIVVAGVLVVSGIAVYTFVYGKQQSDGIQYISVVSANGTRQTIDLNLSNSYLIRPANYTGNTFSFSAPINRIVSLAPSITSTLYGIGSIGKVVGVDAFSDYPPNLNVTVMTYDSGYAINDELIAYARPQLVIAPGDGYFASNQENTIANTFHIPFLLMSPNSVQQIENETIELGQITGNSANATNVSTWMQSSMTVFSTHLANVTSYLKAFYYLSAPGVWTAGEGTFINQFFSIAHLVNIANGTGYYQESLENITVADPQVIFLDEYVNGSYISGEPFDSTSAVTNGKVFTLYNDDVFSEPDFRVIYAIGWMISQVYPQNFNVSNIPQFPVSLQYQPGSGI